MKATALLRQKHKALARLLARVAEDRAQRVALMLQLIEELMTHLLIENRLFLEPIAAMATVRIDAHRDDHARIRNAILQAVFVEADDAAFAVRLEDLAGAFNGHVRTLERELLPAVEARIAEDDLESMGKRMQAVWARAMGSGRSLQAASRELAAP